MDPTTEIIQQAPGIAAVIFIVITFVRYLEKRDKMLEAFIALMTKELHELAVAISNHSRETSDGIAEMHRTVRRQELQDKEQNE